MESPVTVLRHADFRRLFTGTSISLLGSSVTAVALPLTAVVYLHASPAQMGLLGAMSLLPHLVFGLPAGVWVRSFSYRRMLVVTDLARFPLLACVPVLAMFGVLQQWHLYLVAFLAGVGNLLETVAAQSFIPVVVPPKDLLPANSSLMLVNSTVTATGSALGGFIVSLLTAPIALAVDAVSFLVSGLVKTRISAVGAIATNSSHARQRMLPGILDGLRAVFGHPVIRTVTIAAVIGALAGQMQGVILILYLVRELTFPSTLVGVAIAVLGVAGMLAAGLVTRVTRRLGPGRTFIAGMLMSSTAGLILSAAGGNLVLAFGITLVAQIAAGTGPALYGVNQQTLRQVLVSPDLLPHANATWRFLVHGVRALGAVLGGLVASVVDLRTTMVVGSALMLAGVAVASASPLRTMRELPERDDPVAVVPQGASRR